MSMKEWIELDIEQLELLDVTDIEKACVKQHILTKRKKAPVWRNIAVATLIIAGSTMVTGYAFPSIASQIPFMENVISYFHDEDEEQRYKNFEVFSTNIGLTETSNDVTVMIDHAVYDGTNITVSFAIETNRDFGEIMNGSDGFDIVGSIGRGGIEQITKVSDTRYVGLTTLTPHFKDDVYPETVEVTWKPRTFYSISNDLKVEGDWSFSFSLKRLAGNIQLVNETVQHKDINFTLKSIEATDVSTVIDYEQVATEELLEQWPSVTPVFRVSDDLGHVYVNETGGGGVAHGKTFEGTTTFGPIQENARQLIIQPIEVASLLSGEGHIKIELDPIVIVLND